MKKILLVLSVFLLSSCMKLESEIVLDSNGIASSKATIDMSKFMTIMSAFGSGGEATNSINKNLCLDENFSGWLYESLGEEKNKVTDVVCTSVGDYKAMVVGKQDLSHKKWILFLSGVTIVDMLALGDDNRVPWNGDDDFSEKDAEQLGFSIVQSYTVPGNISYYEAGVLSGSSTVVLNLLDPKILRKQSLIVISTADWRKLTTREINAYKLKLRKYNRSVK